MAFDWSVDFWIVSNHARPICEFKPSVVLVTSMAPGDTFQVVPVPASRGAGCRGRGAGRGRARGRGRGTGAPGHASAGRGGAAADIANGGVMLALDDGEVGESCAESSADSAAESNEPSSETDVECSDEDHPPSNGYGIERQCFHIMEGVCVTHHVLRAVVL